MKNKLSRAVRLPKKVMTAVEVVEFVANYYGKDPTRRSLDADNALKCLYNGPDGRCCAFALFTQDRRNLKENENANKLLKVVKLRKPVRHLQRAVTFWHALQRLHDYSACWSASGGLTTIGTRARDELISVARRVDKRLPAPK